ncbi:MAG: hypothetical protein N4A46_10740 [Schleiferiaceae bacterium]|jgi:hypothetical protein|nr:hypothetical protein [Schleiferiaceae bacterium]
MTKIEKILSGIFFAAIAMKVLRLPGADILMILGGGTLAMFYYVGGYFVIHNVSLRKLLKEKKGKDMSPAVLIGSIVAGWDFSLIVLGLLFKIMFFPGADNMLILGVIFLTLIQIGSIFTRKTNPEAFSRFFNRVLIWFGLGVSATFVSNNTIIDYRYGHDPAYADAFKAYLQNPQDSAAAHDFEVEKARYLKERQNY